jgi:membrane-associated phospholipid phosphatase
MTRAGSGNVRVMTRVGLAPQRPIRDLAESALSPRPGRADPLSPRPGGREQRLAGVLPAPPAVVFALVLLGGTLLLAAGSILLGLLVTQGLIAGLGLGDADAWLAITLSQHRDPTLTTMSEVGSTLAGGVVLPLVVAVVGLAAAALRRWRVAAFAVFVLIAESSAYRLTTLAIHRERPDVPRLEHLPADASYPSGHTAASIAVYAGLALLITARMEASWRRVALWIAVALVVVFVVLSRLYRGMHHPLDVLGGAAIGVGAILLLLLACRTAGGAARARARR